jgi:hypothetical protein
LAKHALTTRRDLFAAAPAIALAGIPLSSSAAASGDLTSRWRVLLAEREAFDARRGVTDEEVDDFIDRWNDANDELFQAPIRCMADAKAKLDSALYSFSWGGLCSKTDVQAVADVARYLGAL